MSLGLTKIEAHRLHNMPKSITIGKGPNKVHVPKDSALVAVTLNQSPAAKRHNLKRLIIVLDASEAMNQQIQKSTKTRFDYLQEQLKNLHKPPRVGIPEDVEIVLVYVDDKVNSLRLKKPFLSFRRRSSTNVSTVLDKISTLKPKGEGNISGGLEEATRILEGLKPKERNLLLIANGSKVPSQEVLESALNKLSTYNLGSYVIACDAENAGTAINMASQLGYSQWGTLSSSGDTNQFHSELQYELTSDIQLNSDWVNILVSGVNEGIGLISSHKTRTRFVSSGNESLNMPHYNGIAGYANQREFQGIIPADYPLTDVHVIAQVRKYNNAEPIETKRIPVQHITDRYSHRPRYADLISSMGNASFLYHLAVLHNDSSLAEKMSKRCDELRVSEASQGTGFLQIDTDDTARF